jgi:hypothetical protein
MVFFLAVMSPSFCCLLHYWGFVVVGRGTLSFPPWQKQKESSHSNAIFFFGHVPPLFLFALMSSLLEILFAFLV